MPDDRDTHRPKHPRAQSQPAAAAAPDVEVDEETSQAYEVGPLRDRFRADRSDAERLRALERFKDDTTSTMTKFGADLGEVKGGVATLVKIHTEAAAAKEREELRELELAKLRQAGRDKSSARAWALLSLIVVKILAPLAAGLGLLFAAYKAGGG